MDDLARAQRQLGRSLDRARAGEDRGLSALVREQGERFIKLCNGVLGMARLHAPDNHALDQPVRDFETTLQALVQILGAVQLMIVEDQAYLNEIRIRLDGVDAAHDLGERLRRHAVGGLTFHAPLGEAQIRALIGAVAAAPAGDEPRWALEDALAEKGIEAVELHGLQRFRISGEKKAGAREARTISAHAAALVDRTLHNVATGRMANPLPLRRVVVEMLGNEDRGEAIGANPEGTTAYASHTTRVCWLAVLLGRAIGLPADALQDLGLAAMFHDIGYSMHGGPPASGETRPAAPLERHPTAGARLILKQRGFHEAKIRRVLATLDHHRRYDDPDGRPSLLGRVLAIVDDYDIWVSPRGGGLSPDVVLERMAAESGATYDPVLLQVFINQLGRFPPGTTLDLRDGRTVRVVSLVRSPETFDRPLVRVERLANGEAPAEETIVDLAVEGEIGKAEPAAAPEAPASAAYSGSASVDVVPPIELGGSRRQLFEGVLPEVLRELYVGGKTGVLHLTRGEERRSVRFWKGHIVYAQSNVPEEHMGELAVREGRMTAADLARATELVVRENKRLGIALGVLGIMTDVQVEGLIASHAREVLVKAFPWKDGSYDFERQTAEASWFDEMALHLSTPDIILEAVRRIEADDVVRFHLGDLDRVLVLAERAPKVPINTLTPLDSFVLSRIDGTSTARQVIAIVPYDAPAVQRSLFGLLCTGLVLHRKTRR